MSKSTLSSIIIQISENGMKFDFREAQTIYEIIHFRYYDIVMWCLEMILDFQGILNTDSDTYEHVPLLREHKFLEVGSVSWCTHFLSHRHTFTYT